MALVSSSPTHSAPLYPQANPLHTSSDSSHLGGRPTGGPSTAPAMHSGTPYAQPASYAPRKLSASQVPGQGGTGNGTNWSGGAPPGVQVRPLPSPQPSRARTSSAPYVDGSVSGTGASSSSRSSPSAGGGMAPLPPPARVPSRSSSTPPVSSSSSSSLHRPSPTPTPGARSSSSSSVRSGHHAHSASSSSSASYATPAVPALPRLPPAHFTAGAPSPSAVSAQALPFYPSQPSPGHHQGGMPSLATHPSFINQPFPPAFASPFPHPGYPFIPSPHPNGPAGPFPYGTASMNGLGSNPPTPGEQQKRLQQYQQQYQLEVLMKQQQAAAAQLAAQGDWQQRDGQRRRASSGPANHSPTYYTSPLPSNPNGGQNQIYPVGMTGAAMPALPPGAMLPHFGGHGYPTPPGSVEGVGSGGGRGGGGGSGGESGSSSGGSGTGRVEGGYHPYRRDGARSAEGGRSSSSHRASPSTSSVLSNGGVGGRSAAASRQQYSRAESSASVPALSNANFPPLPSSQPSTPVGGSPATRGSASSSGRSTPASSSTPSASSVSLPRTRTDSQNSSSSSSLHAASSSARQRHDSNDTGRSSTPVQARQRPSPLAGPSQNQNQSEDEDDGAESDGTAEATATISTGLVSSATMTSMAETVGKGKQVEREPVQEKEKEKKGMKSRFKKAFGVSNSTSSNSLANLEVDGRGPAQLNGGFRSRRDSSSSSDETSTAPHTPPTAPYATHQHHPSVASIASTATLGNDAASTAGASTRKPPSTSRFRLLNPKMNSSTDNISISSTVSSASVMIRKLGQMGKLARRNSLMGLTKAFKKDKNKDGQGGDGDESSYGVEAPSAGGKLSKKDKKKGAVATASVSHATAEYDSSSPSSSSFANGSGISPAAALARKHQQAYAEQEAAEARAAAAEEAARLGPPQRSFEQLPSNGGGHSRNDSDSSSMRSASRWGRSKTAEDAADARGKAVEKEKAQLKSRRWKLGFGGGGGSKTDLAETGSINNDDAASTFTAATERTGSAFGHYEDATPRQSLEVLAPPGSLGYQTYGARVDAAGQDSEGEYEPSLYRQGATPVPQARAVRGILKGAGTYRQEDYASTRAPFNRNRAASFDAPQQQGRPGSPGGAALVNVIPSEAQVDGVAPSSTSPRTDTHPPSSSEIIADAAISRVHPDTSTSLGSSPYSHPGLNASAPVLAHFASQPSMRSSSAPGTPGRRIAFAANLSVHTTWPATIYDRRAEPATCNRLTPALAQAIKEELNSFKMEEMDVHPSSRKLTHFFV
ncbi:hypothetical protein JCM8547_005243 [Rhodosporidiobolus lusitaniae]